MEWYNLLLLLGVGTLAGFINALAGGGSILTVPALIFIGLPASVANGTNRIAVVAQSLSSVASYHKENFRLYKQSGLYALAALPGALLGAFTAVQISDDLFKRILAVLTILIVLTLFIPITKGQNDRAPKSSRLLFIPAMVAIGFYGGFLQIGVGFMIMAALYHLEKLDLIKVNIHKVFLMLLFTAPALLIFVLSGRVQWLPGLVLAAGNATGAWWGAKANIKGGEKLIRIMVAVAAMIMAAKLFELF